MDASQESPYITELSGEKLRVVEQARTATMEILEDALEKRFYGFPVSFYYSCGEPVDSYKFSCIPTEKILRDLLRKTGEVLFREDSDPENSDTFAYVSPGHDAVYLCNSFWSAPDDLRLDSKPGTIIHEVSHLLGTDDITYELLTVELYENHGTLLGKSSNIEGQDGKMHCREEVAQVNANCLEHEFETVINHEKSYEDGRYSCCGEIKKNSVCRRRETGHYHLHERFGQTQRMILYPRENKRKEMEEKLQSLVQHPDDHNQRMKYVKIRNSACRKSYSHQP